MKRYILFPLLCLWSIALSAQCIDFTDLRSSAVKCTYGDFYNPYKNTGIIDDGPSAASSRHTIHINKSETDFNTGNRLRTVPPGENASVRLGNWRTGAQAESITYEYEVDEDENPILVFKYAAVMEDPGHIPSEQPRLTLEILDENNKMVDSYCGAFDFIASSELGWNKTNSGVLWKDWTSVGLDLSAYSGQTIHIRFTTYDCEQSGHFGYAYLNISCQQKKIKSLACGLNAMSTFSGPDGFEYKWYTLDGTNKKMVSDMQSITVPTDETTYYCDVNQTGKPTCSFTLNVKANPRLPLANFNYQVKGTCVDTLFLTNMSSVSKDGQLPNIPQEDCDEYIWELGDGRVITTKDIESPIVYAQTGYYTVKLTAKLTDGGCEHSVSQTFFMHGYQDDHTVHLYDTICSNEYILFGSQKLDQSGTYTIVEKTSYGCDSTTIMHLQVNPNYYFEDAVSICSNNPYNFRGQILTHSGVYYDSLQTKLGCDSIYKLTLQVHPTSLIETSVTICDNETYEFRGRKLNQTGVYYDSLFTKYGCDSVYKLNLTVHKAYLINQVIQICNGESYTFKGKNLTESGIYYDSLITVNGCDSIIRLVLKINPTYLHEQEATICDNEFYDFRGQILNKEGVYYDYLKTSSGCDSTYKLTLHVNPTYLIEEKVSTCTNQPYLYREKTYTESGIYIDSLKTTTGCDSIYKLDLTVYPSYVFEESAIICDFDTYKFQGQLLNKTGIYYDTIPTVHGCDSVYILNLRTRPTLKDTINASVCLGDYYLFAGNMLYNDGTYIDTIYQPATDGCEIHTLNLSTVASTIISSAYVDNACADNEKYQIKYFYTGPRPITYSIYYDLHSRQMGFKDVINAPFTDSISDFIPQFADKIYLKPDFYNARLEFNNGTCSPSESAYDLTFMIMYPSWILEQNWNDVVAVLNKENNGGYSFSRFDWYANNKIFITDGHSYIYEPQYFHAGDAVYADLTRENDDYSICTCPIIITNNNDKIAYDEPLLINVNPASRAISFIARRDITFVLYNAVGQIVGSGCLQTDQAFTQSLTSGMYILQTSDHSGNSVSTKIMIP